MLFEGSRHRPTLVVRFIHMMPECGPILGRKARWNGICPGNMRLSRTTSLEGLASANRSYSLGSSDSTARPRGPMPVPNLRVQPFLLGLSLAPPSADTPLRHFG